MRARLQSESWIFKEFVRLLSATLFHISDHARCTGYGCELNLQDEAISNKATGAEKELRTRSKHEPDGTGEKLERSGAGLYASGGFIDEARPALCPTGYPTFP